MADGTSKVDARSLKAECPLQEPLICKASVGPTSHEFTSDEALEFHQRELQLIREQMTTFACNVTCLREQVQQVSLQRRLDAACLESLQEVIHRDKQDLRDEMLSLLPIPELKELGGAAGQSESSPEDTPAKYSGLAPVHADIRFMHERLSRCEEQSALIGNLQRSQITLLENEASFESQHTSLQTRICCLEKTVAELAEKEIQDMLKLKVAQSQHSQDIEDGLKLLEGTMRMVDARLSDIEQATGTAMLRDLEQFHERYEDLHSRMEACESFRGILDDLSGAQDKLSGQTNQIQSVHDALRKDVNDLERSVNNRTLPFSAEDLLMQVSRLQERVSSCEEARNSIAELRNTQMDIIKSSAAMVSVHETVKDRLTDMENTFSDSIGRHTKQLEDLCALSSDNVIQHARWSALHERVGSVEEQLRECLAGKCMGDVADLHAKLTQEFIAMSKRRCVAKDAHACEEQEVRDDCLLDISRRIDFLEGMLGESVELVLEQAKFASEARTWRDQHSLLEERVRRVESEGRQVLPASSS